MTHRMNIPNLITYFAMYCLQADLNYQCNLQQQYCLINLQSGIIVITDLENANQVFGSFIPIFCYFILIFFLHFAP